MILFAIIVASRNNKTDKKNVFLAIRWPETCVLSLSSEFAMLFSIDSYAVIFTSY